MNYKLLHISTVAFLAGASTVFGVGALTTGSLNLSGSQSFEGEPLISECAVVESNPVLEVNSELSDEVGTMATEDAVVLSGESSFESETIVTGGEVVEADNGQVDADGNPEPQIEICVLPPPIAESSDGEVDETGGEVIEVDNGQAGAEGNEEPQIVICEPMMPPPTAESPEGEVDELGGKVVEIDKGQVDEESNEGVTPTSDNGELQLTGEGAFDGEVFVTGGRIEANQRNNASPETTISLPVYSTGAGVFTIQRGALSLAGGSSSFAGETVMTGGKIVNRDPSAENAVEEVTLNKVENAIADDKAVSESEKPKQTKNVGASSAPPYAEVSDSAQSAVLKGGRVFLR